MAIECTFIVDAATLRENVGWCIEDIKIEELMVALCFYDEVTKFSSLEILKEAQQ
jgi:hypothetical protein